MDEIDLLFARYPCERSTFHFFSPSSLFLQRNKIFGLVRHEVKFKNALAGLSLKIDYETINSASEVV